MARWYGLGEADWQAEAGKFNSLLTRWSDLPGLAAYLRLHGRDPIAYLTGKTVAERFHYDYSDDELGEVAERAHRLATETDEVHVVFNNNSRDFAPKAAERLRHRLGQVSRKKAGPLRQENLF